MKNGSIYGKLTVKSFFEMRKTHGYYLVKCECGSEKVVAATSLISGKTKSCGCLHRENVIAANTKHGMYKTKLYHVWSSMKDRCRNPLNPRYARYGGRGIQVCDSWISSYENFIADMGPKPSCRHTVDRIDNNGNYTPENCRWATNTDQQKNKTNNVILEFNGEQRLQSEWTKIFECHPDLIRYHLKTGKTFSTIAERLGNK